MALGVSSGDMSCTKVSCISQIDRSSTLSREMYVVYLDTLSLTISISPVSQECMVGFVFCEEKEAKAFHKKVTSKKEKCAPRAVC